MQGDIAQLREGDTLPVAIGVAAEGLTPSQASSVSIAARGQILLLEELAAIRGGVRLLLETVPELHVTGEASSLAEVEELSWEPDVVVHGLLLPDRPVPEVVPSLRARFPAAKLLVFSRLDHPGYVHMTMTQGARGYVRKSAPAAQLLSAVMAVAEGGEYVEPALGASLARSDVTSHRGRTDWAELTTREMEVAELIALGYSSVDIGKALGIAPRTVDTHRSHIGQKLGSSSRADIVRFVASRK